METSETEALLAPGDAQKPIETVETSQPSKKRSLEDMQRDAEPDASEPHQAPSTGPEAKRAKTGQTDKKETLDEDDDENGAEEGELEEDDEDAQASNSGSGEIGGGKSSDSQKLAVEAGSKRMTRSMSAAANDSAHVGWNQGITSQIRTSLGGTAKAKALPAPTKTKSKEPAPEPEPEVEIEVEVEPTPATESAPPQAAQSTAPAKKESAKKVPLTRAERRQEKQAQTAAESKKAQEDLKKPFEYAPGLSFFLPSKKNILSPKGNNLGSGVWKSKFQSWCQSFVSRNIDQKNQLSADIAVAALQEYIATRAHWSKKKHKGVAAGEARKPHTRDEMAVNLATILKNDDYLAKSAGTGTGTEDSPMIIEDDDDDDDVQEIAPPSGTTTPANAQIATSNTAHSAQREGAVQPLLQLKEESDSISDDGMESGRPGPVVMSEQDDLAEQRKYFPGLAESECICIYCATPGHTSSACPRTACKFCEGEDHFSWNCPTRERCTKCRQLGHGKGQCTEKLISLDEEGAECATCGSQAHDEDDCEVLWRSYKPQNGMIKKVNVLPAFCGACGAEGHYSSDCAFRGDKSRSRTWSLKNRDRYFDKNAADGPISNFASIPKPPQLQIKGASASRNHIFYADSDGSEEGEFLAQKVKPRAPPGNIQMSTNIQLGNFGVQQQQQQQQQPRPQPQQNGRGQQRGGWSAQPPLPAGPPPPGPPPGGSYSRMSKSYNNQSRPPPPNNGAGRGGLPPKPPAPQHGYHTVAPPPNGPGPNAKKPRTRQPANAPSGPSHQQNGGGAGGRRRGKNRRGGKQG